MLHSLDPNTDAVDEGLCELCGNQPADHLGLVCHVCRQAIEEEQPWALSNEDLLLRLQELESEDDYR